MSQRPRSLLPVGIGLAGVVTQLSLGWLAIALFFDSYLIVSEGMAPTLGVDDRVLARPTDGDGVTRGDIILLAPPDPSSAAVQVVVKRVVAVGGDEIGANDGFVTINGERADEEYLADSTFTEDFGPVDVPDAHVFVMGDNRANSQDSRAYGPVPNEDVEARVIVQWWPLSEFEQL